jgi:hypothetical protein
VEADVLDCLSLQGSCEGHAVAINDILAQLVENAAQRELGRNVRCGSTLFPETEIDICYPSDGTVPRVGALLCVVHPRSPSSDSFAARPDTFRDAVQHAAWTSYDFKLQHCEPAPIASIGSWIQAAKPRFFSFWLVHVESDAQFVERRATLNALRSHCNGVGVMFFGADSRRPGDSVAHAARELHLDRALREMIAGVVAAELSTSALETR